MNILINISPVPLGVEEFCSLECQDLYYHVGNVDLCLNLFAFVVSPLGIHFFDFFCEQLSKSFFSESVPSVIVFGERRLRVISIHFKRRWWWRWSEPSTCPCFGKLEYFLLRLLEDSFCLLSCNFCPNDPGLGTPRHRLTFLLIRSFPIKGIVESIENGLVVALGL